MRVIAAVWAPPHLVVCALALRRIDSLLRAERS